MYDAIYKNRAEKGLAKKWEEEKILDKEGNTVMDEEHMYGHPKKYNLTHPEKMIFVDEVGDNTSQANDGHKTGTSMSQEVDGEHSSKTRSLNVTTPLLDSPLPPESRSRVPLSLLLAS
jgi:hypothetical protein